MELLVKQGTSGASPPACIIIMLLINSVTVTFHVSIHHIFECLLVDCLACIAYKIRNGLVIPSIVKSIWLISFAVIKSVVKVIKRRGACM